MGNFELVFASGNRHKFNEFTALLSKLPAIEGKKLTLLQKADLPDDCPDVEETGESYEENALLKAVAYARFTGMAAIADDSGLEVRALGGAPGIRSARAAEGDDADRVRWLLGQMSGITERRACFVACLVVAFPGTGHGETRTENGCGYFAAEGRCFGRIGYEPRGACGFGYDPVFIPDGHDASFGELGDEVKAKISHRAIALRGVAEIMPSVLKYIAVHKRSIAENGYPGRCTDR